MPFVLNVAGPRESKARGIQKRTREFLVETLGGMLESRPKDDDEYVKGIYKNITNVVEVKKVGNGVYEVGIE